MTPSTIITFSSDFKLYLPAIGLIGLALYQLSQGEYSQAGTSILAAFAAFKAAQAPAIATAPTN